ncbi:MAG: hypothetical protein ACE5G8_08805, partial [Anaerolineae bacterium]
MTTTKTKTGIFSPATFKALAEQLNEPQWLAQKRRAAWNIFEDTPMPATSDEPWRRTSLKKIKWAQFSPLTPPTVPPAQTLAGLPQPLRALLDEGRAAAGRLLIINGQVRYPHLTPAVAEQGVI